MGTYKAQRDDAARIVQGRNAELARKRAELGRYMSRSASSAPALKKAALADQCADLIDELMKDAMPTQVKEVAEEMTKAWKAMAHMSDRIDRIEITPACEVRMLTSSGENIHSIDKSAGKFLPRH